MCLLWLGAEHIDVHFHCHHFSYASLIFSSWLFDEVRIVQSLSLLSLPTLLSQMGFFCLVPYPGADKLVKMKLKPPQWTRLVEKLVEEGKWRHICFLVLGPAAVKAAEEGRRPEPGEGRSVLTRVKMRFSPKTCLTGLMASPYWSLQLLIELNDLGANWNQPDSNDVSPLRSAWDRGMDDAVLLFLEFRVDPGTLCGLRLGEGSTPIHVATRYALNGGRFLGSPRCHFCFFLCRCCLLISMELTV